SAEWTSTRTELFRGVLSIGCHGCAEAVTAAPTVSATPRPAPVMICIVFFSMDTDITTEPGRPHHVETRVGSVGDNQQTHTRYQICVRQCPTLPHRPRC